MDTKLCKRCNTTKPTEEFWANKTRKDGLQLYCIACLTKYPNRKAAQHRYEEKHVRPFIKGVRTRIRKENLAQVSAQLGMGK